MKRIVFLALCIIFSSAITSCSRTAIVTNNNKSLPPGQAKKIAGSKSAAPFAPGQKKKGTTNNPKGKQ